MEKYTDVYKSEKNIDIFPDYPPRTLFHYHVTCRSANHSPAEGI